MRRNIFSWWISCIRAQLYNLDILRVDHFRGFEAFWSIPYGRTDRCEWRMGKKLRVMHYFPQSVMLLRETFQSLQKIWALSPRKWKLCEMNLDSQA